MNKRWINTKVEFIWDGTQYVEQSVDGYWYDGEMALCWTTTTDPYTFQGEVGIGTDNPSTLLEVEGTTGLPLRLHNQDFGAEIATRLRSKTSGGQYVHADIVQTPGSSEDQGYIGFRIPYNASIPSLILDHNQRVGIGTTSPDEFLHIYSSADDDPAIKLENGRGGGDGALFFQHRGSSVTMDSTGSDPIHFRMSGNAKMSLLANGNVGIGTSDPPNALTVHKAISNDFVAELKQTHSTAGQAWGVQICGGTNSSDAALVVENEAENASLLYVRGDGNVGIGTSSPGAKLDVAGDVAFSKGSRTTLYPTTTNQALHMKSNGTGALQFNNDSAGDIDMVVGGGSVGIGASGLADGSERMLKIYGHGNSGDSTLGIVRFFNDSTAIAQIDVSRQDDDTSGQFAIRTNDSNGGLSERFTIKPDGNVGIGDDTPSYKLEVAGTFYASGSSQAFKKNVTDLAVDSSAIYNLNPKSYNYKKDYENFGYDLAEGKQFGLISEEVAEAVPELAIMKDGEPKNVDYQKLSVLLLAEMQKMNKRIKDLECHI